MRLWEKTPCCFQEVLRSSVPQDSKPLGLKHQPELCQAENRLGDPPTCLWHLSPSPRLSG